MKLLEYSSSGMIAVTEIEGLLGMSVNCPIKGKGE